MVGEMLLKIEKEQTDLDDKKVSQNVEKLELLSKKHSRLAQIKSEAKARFQSSEIKLRKLMSNLNIVATTKTDLGKLQREQSDTQQKDVLAYPVKESDVKLKKFRSGSSDDSFHSNMNDPDKNYFPIKFTSKAVSKNPDADLDLLIYPDNFRPLLDFNKYDQLHQIDRTSINGYVVKEGLPLNPVQKTGFYGRGHLLYWGPNHGVQAIFTRSKNENFTALMECNEEKKHMYSLPFILNGSSKTKDIPLEKRLVHELFDESLIDANVLKELYGKLYKSEKIDTYIPKSELNTDNAWLELTVLHFHDENDDLFKLIPIKSKLLKQSVLEWKLVDDGLMSKTDSRTKKYLKYLQKRNS